MPRLVIAPQYGSIADLEITEVEPGYAPFVVGRENHVIEPTPLLPDDPD